MVVLQVGLYKGCSYQFLIYERFPCLFISSTPLFLLSLDPEFKWSLYSYIQGISIALQKTKPSSSEHDYIANLGKCTHDCKQKVNGQVAVLVKSFQKCRKTVIDFVKPTEAILMHDFLNILLVHEGKPQLLGHLLGNKGSFTANLTGNSNDSHRHLLW